MASVYRPATRASAADGLSRAELESRLGELHPQLLVLEKTYRTFARIHWFVACHYRLEFEGDEGVSERVLWPESPTERQGMEDARFVRFVEDDGEVVYRGTYTAYNGTDTATQLIETTDFQSFQMSQLFGPAVGNKGLALFPRRIGGRYMAMSRWDRESNSIAVSDDGKVWADSQGLDIPAHPWALTQVGNCGSPIETEAGWLVLTHGVGPMRKYAVGAFLLASSTLPFLYNVYKTTRSPKVTVDDPWGWGRSLEWATSCPPPRHNFVSIPRIRSESPAFDLHHPEIAAIEYSDDLAESSTGSRGEGEVLK